MSRMDSGMYNWTELPACRQHSPYCTVGIGGQDCRLMYLVHEKYNKSWMSVSLICHTLLRVIDNILIWEGETMEKAIQSQDWHMAHNHQNISRNYPEWVSLCDSSQTLQPNGNGPMNRAQLVNVLFALSLTLVLAFFLTRHLKQHLAIVMLHRLH